MGTLPHLGHTQDCFQCLQPRNPCRLQTNLQQPSGLWAGALLSPSCPILCPLTSHSAAASQVYFIPLLSSAHMTFPLGLKSHSFSLTPTQ